MALHGRQHGWLRAALRRRSRAQDVDDFRFLIATPANLGSVAASGQSTTVALPANARLAVSLNAVTVAGDIGLDDLVGVVFGGGGVSGFVQRFDTTPESRAVSLKRSAGCPAGAATLYVLDEWHIPHAIATATFT